MESVVEGSQPIRPLGLHKLAGIWFVLVAISVVGRLWQPAWNVTPLTGAAIAAGSVFGSVGVAASVPLTALAVSNLALPGYGVDGWRGIVMVTVIAVCLSWPVLLGRLTRTGRTPPLIGGALASSLVFYLATNFAHWMLNNDYPHTAAGLAACYAAALPFFRWMPVGDVFWTLALVGGLAAMGATAASAKQFQKQTASAA